MPIAALLVAAALAQAPPGFQTDLAGGVHAECYTVTGGLQCNLYGGKPRVLGKCDFGGLVPTITVSPPSLPSDGFICVDEGYHGWKALPVGGTWKQGELECASRLVVKSGRAVGRLECAGFSADGDGARDLAATPTKAKTIRNCGRVSFQAQTDNGAFGIRAQGTTCATAKRVARASKNHGVGRTPYRFTTRGYTCRGIESTDALPTVNWSCVKGQAIVLFDRS